MGRVKDPEGSPPRLSKSEQLIEAVQVAEMFKPLPGYQAPPGSPAVRVLMARMAVTGKTNKENRTGKPSVVVTREMILASLDKHKAFKAGRGENPTVGWRETLGAQLTAWKYLKPRLPEIGITVAEIEAYLRR